MIRHLALCGPSSGHVNALKGKLKVLGRTKWLQSRGDVLLTTKNCWKLTSLWFIYALLCVKQLYASPWQNLLTSDTFVVSSFGENLNRFRTTKQFLYPKNHSTREGIDRVKCLFYENLFLWAQCSYDQYFYEWQLLNSKYKNAKRNQVFISV